MNNFREIENGSVFLITLPEASVVPLFCPLCEFPMQTQDDGISFREVGCCYLCDLEYRTDILKSVEHNQLERAPGVVKLSNEFIDRFKLKETERWESYLSKRKARSKRTINIK